MVFDFNTLGNAEGFIYEPWHWALEAVHRFAITDSLLKAIGLRLVSSYSELRIEAIVRNFRSCQFSCRIMLDPFSLFGEAKECSESLEFLET